MKKLVLSAAAVAFAGSAYAADTFGVQPAQSYNPFSGHIEGYIGGVRASAYGESESGLTFGGASRLNYNFNQNWNIQGDLLFDEVSLDIEDFDVRFSNYGAAAHIYWRDPNSFALGGFVTVDRYDTNLPILLDTNRYTVGAEGQVYFDRFTLYGQAYWGQVRLSEIGFIVGESASLDLWGLRGVARYFVTDNFRIDGELGYQNLNFDELGEDVDQTTFTAALQANYRFTGTPLTVFGRYQYENVSVDEVSEFDFDVHKFVVGLRVPFGRDTLLAEDRTGATMDTARQNLPVASPLSSPSYLRMLLLTGFGWTR